MLLAASPDRWMDQLPEGVVGLPMPLKVYDLINTVEMIQETQQRADEDAGGTERNESERQIRTGESSPHGAESYVGR